MSSHLSCMQLFQSTLPVRGGAETAEEFGIPIPFQSTLPVRGGASMSCWSESFATIFQSTLPVRGGTVGPYIKPITRKISIHPPRAGRDGKKQQISGFILLWDRASCQTKEKSMSDKKNIQQIPVVLFAHTAGFRVTSPVRTSRGFHVCSMSAQGCYFNPAVMI